jgi:hypothetical protein
VMDGRCEFPSRSGPDFRCKRRASQIAYRDDIPIPEWWGDEEMAQGYCWQHAAICQRGWGDDSKIKWREYLRRPLDNA